jgi:hypothetical protein
LEGVSPTAEDRGLAVELVLWWGCGGAGGARAGARGELRVARGAWRVFRCVPGVVTLAPCFVRGRSPGRRSGCAPALGAGSRLSFLCSRQYSAPEPPADVRRNPRSSPLLRPVLLHPAVQQRLPLSRDVPRQPPLPSPASKLWPIPHARYLHRHGAQLVHAEIFGASGVSLGHYRRVDPSGDVWRDILCQQRRRRRRRWEWDGDGHRHDDWCSNYRYRWDRRLGNEVLPS